MKYPNLNNFNLEKIQKWINDFASIYSFNSYFYFRTDKQYSLGNKKHKICRYCKKGVKETSFRSNSHLAPKIIGNKFIRSYYECDRCNRIFGNYETDLANFIGLRRYFLHPNEFEKSRKTLYKSKSGKSLLYTSKRGIEISDLKKEIFEVLDDKKGFKCIVKKQPYTPLNVYKSLVKIVLATLNEEAIKQFDKTIDFITSKKFDNDKIVDSFAKLSIITFSDFHTDFPIIYVFLRNRKFISKYDDNTFKIPNKTFILYIKSFCYQIFLPFDNTDKYSNENINKLLLFIHPPSIFNPKELNFKTYIQYFHELKNLSSVNKNRNEEDEFYILNNTVPILFEYSDEERKALVKKYGL